HFIHGTEKDIPEGIQFDVIITNFYLDLFSDSNLNPIIKLLRSHLKGKSIWLVSDFVYSNKLWQKILLWIMYRFFRLTCDIDARDLPAWQLLLNAHGMKELNTRDFFKGFIKS